ncbi:MAG TPA: TadE/TadG family type IV pilus assembly protein [Xanthobacteraceae bacterium]|jgi:Flp pilus assembly protein TadG|nr:TadE/TadG family type IV pilus assembly protein [Xanthobacteraceae bacterium]
MLARLFRSTAVRLRRDERGVSAVEFAMLAPLMVTLYFGCVEISQALSASRKLTLVTHTVADLVAQASQPITNMTDILAAGQAVIMPFSSASLHVQVSSLTIDAANNVSVAWTKKYNWTSAVATPTLDPALNVANSSLIWTQTQYEYSPPLGAELLKMLGLPNGSITMTEQTFLRPRVLDPMPQPTG